MVTVFGAMKADLEQLGFGVSRLTASIEIDGYVLRLTSAGGGTDVTATIDGKCDWPFSIRSKSQIVTLMEAMRAT